MKVAIIPSSVDPVGVSTHVFNLAYLLKENRMLDIVICPKEGWLTQQLSKYDLPYHIVNMSHKPKRFISSSLNLFQFLKSRNCLDIVHVHGRFPLFVSLLSMFLLKDLRFVVTVHQFSSCSTPGFLNWMNNLETIILRHAIKKICCVSQALKNEVLQRLGYQYKDKIFVINNWIQPMNYNCAAKGLNNHNKTRKTDNAKVVAVGRLSHEKGFEVLIDAINIMVKHNINVTCDIYGEGPEGIKLVSIINERSLNNHVQLKGYCADIRAILYKYDFLVVPSLSESFGIVVLEAYDAGIPVVASNIPGLNEIIDDGKSGLLFEPGNSYSLFKQMMNLIDNPELMASLIRYSSELVKRYYPSNSLIRQFQFFYDINHE